MSTDHSTAIHVRILIRRILIRTYGYVVLRVRTDGARAALQRDRARVGCGCGLKRGLSPLTTSLRLSCVELCYHISSGTSVFLEVFLHFLELCGVVLPHF